MDTDKIFALARNGDPDASYAVGDMYYDGDGVKRDIAKAMEFYAVAAKAGHVEATYSMGYIYLYGEDFEKNVQKGIELLDYAAKRNHAKANKHLGFVYFWGEDVETDYDKSFAYMLRAAELGDASAQTHIAQAYEGEMWGAPSGQRELAHKYYKLALDQNHYHAQWCMGHNYHGGFHGYPQNYQKAFEFFKMAAENGSDKAQLNLALCYINGEGTAVNWTEAKKWLEIAVENGNAEAAGRLGMLLLGGNGQLSAENAKRGYELLKKASGHGDKVARDALRELEDTLHSWNASLDSWTTTMLGCERESKGDGPQALRYYLKAAGQNCTQAMAFLGSLYHRGMPGVPKDLNLSVQWLKKGAEAGNKTAQLSLGISYLQGSGVDRNVREAEKWLLLAVEQGETGAMLCLADLYQEDPAKYAKAESLYKRVIEAEDISAEDLTGAKCSLGILYGLQERFHLAVPLLRDAAQADNEIAQNMLGHCYFEGCGVPRNVEEAIRWWKKAAANGSAEARERLRSVTPGIQGYQQSPKESGGCYVATAVYGSYDCPQVWTLRRFRDDILAQTWYGRSFIRLYYAVSPAMVKWFGKTAWFVNLFRPVLDRFVKKLNDAGVEDTSYHDRLW